MEHLPELIGGSALLVAAISVLVAIRAVRAARGREQFATQSADRARRMKNEFVSMVSHELRTPLTSIAGFTDTLLESWKHLPPEEIDEFLTIINKQAVHLSELVEDVLVIPRLEAGRLRLDLTMFDVSEVAHDVTNAILPPGTAREAAVAIPGGVTVFADQRRVQQVLRNLVENAHKYGGDQVLVEGSPYGEFYLVVVSDNGPGIPEQDVDRVFTHFEQLSKGDARSDKGIGLGLPIALRLARAMGGDLWYEHRFPTGSRFCFTMRTSPPEVASEADEEGRVVRSDGTIEVTVT
jgi:signal transduction histidine kinase